LKEEINNHFQKKPLATNIPHLALSGLELSLALLQNQ